MKIISGSILASVSLFAEVINEWSSHYFFSALNIAQRISLEGGGEFSIPSAYTNPNLIGINGYGIQIFILTRILLWVFIAFGVALLIWGLMEKR